MTKQSYLAQQWYQAQYEQIMLELVNEELRILASRQDHEDFEFELAA